jgi:hypothetical protein
MKKSAEKVFAFMRSQVDFCVGIAFVIIGAVYYVLSYSQTRGVSDWSLSPGFFPRLAAGFIIGLGTLLSVLSLVSSKKDDASESEKIQKRVMLYVILTIFIMLLYVYLMQWLGFILATILTSAGMMIFLGSRRWVWIIGISIVFPLFIYFFALKIMFVLFPSGTIFE